MRQLRVATRLLGALLIALIARMIVTSPNAADEVSAMVIAALLVASLLLTRRGRRLEPHS